MDTILDKLKGFKKIVYVALCCVFAFLLLCTFILDIDNKAGAITVIVDLVQYLFEGAILAAGLYGLLAGKDAFAKVAFALILGSCLYGLISGALGGMWAFEYFDGARASFILYYVFQFITVLFGTAFAVLVVLGWILGRDDLKKYGGYLGVGYVAMSVLMIVFSIVMVADDMANWTLIIQSIFAVLLRAFCLILATSGVLAFEECDAPVYTASEKEPAEKPVEEQPAEEPAEAEAE